MEKNERAIASMNTISAVSIYRVIVRSQKRTK